MSDDEFDIEQVDRDAVKAGMPKFSDLPKDQQEYYKRLRKVYNKILSSKDPRSHLNVLNATMDKDGNITMDKEIKKGKPIDDDDINIDYHDIKLALKSGLHPKYLSDDERSIMERMEGNEWYDNWA